MTFLGQKLIEIVRQKAAENPSFVYVPERDRETGRYSACTYIRNGRPSCIVGHALFDAGLIDTSLEKTASNSIPFYALADELELGISTDELKWLGGVQKFQDNHRAWGQAVEWTDDPSKRPSVVKALL